MTTSPAWPAPAEQPAFVPTPGRGAETLVLRGHAPALDGLRGLAILLVMSLHFIGNTQQTNGFERAIGFVTGYGLLGVELFFVLSGFLITGILYDSLDRPHYFRNFYMRRVLRIFPLYYGTLIVVFLVVPLFPVFRSSALKEIGEDQLWLWLYGANFFHALQGEWSLSYLNHFWSLAIEEHYYFLWPCLVWLFRRRRHLLVWVSLGIAVISAVGNALANALSGSPTLHMLTPFQFHGLALGSLLAVLARQPAGAERIVRWLPRVALGVAGFLVATFVWHRFSEFGQPVFGPLRGVLFVVLLGCVLLFALKARSGSVVFWFFTSPFMILLGKYSYGLYVFHHFISYYFIRHGSEFVLAEWVGSHTLAVFIQAAFGSAVSLAIAYVSYHLFEKRFLDLKRRFAD